MTAIINKGGPNNKISAGELEKLLGVFAATIPAGAKKILLIPPDFSRFHSAAGEISSILYRLLSKSIEVDLLPALGTHRPMTASEMTRMFPGIPHDRIHIHDWRKGICSLGEIPGEFVGQLSGGKVDYPVRVELACRIVAGKYDAIISISQVVPHEVVGMAGGNKNLLVGCAGPDTINKSHFLGAVCNMEKIMGHIDSPVRQLLNEAEDRFLAGLPISYILTVRARDENGALVTRGLFAGQGRGCYQPAALLSQQVNIVKVKPLKKTVVYLDPDEFKSTWLGNKAIYRTRMAVADGGELLIIAPGLVEFGEAEINDRLIRKYGYHGTPAALQAVAENEDLRQNLGAAAHLIHGSSEGRFKIIYAPGGLSRKEVESVGFQYTDLQECLARYQPDKLQDGYHKQAGEEFYFISNPAIGLWQA
ncbi:MAG: lactate racemase domain-containing protein [Kiritimatiellia bacterium]|nr:lactate racemase domain-containing protein [Kiritimatiellia bacterium]